MSRAVSWGSASWVWLGDDRRALRSHAHARVVEVREGMNPTALCGAKISPRRDDSATAAYPRCAACATAARLLAAEVLVL